MRTACEGIRRSGLGARWLPCHSSSAPRRAPVALYIALDDPEFSARGCCGPLGGTWKPSPASTPATSTASARHASEGVAYGCNG